MLSHEIVLLHIKTIQCEKYSVGSFNIVLHYVIYQLCLRNFCVWGKHRFNKQEIENINTDFIFLYLFGEKSLLHLQMQRKLWTKLFDENVSQKYIACTFSFVCEIWNVMSECLRSTYFEEHHHFIYKVTHSRRQVLTKQIPPKYYEHPQNSKVKTEIQYLLIITLCMFTLVYKIITIHKNWPQYPNNSFCYLSIPPTNSILHPQMLSIHFIPCILIYC